jgi:hypothetical protein
MPARPVAVMAVALACVACGAREPPAPPGTTSPAATVATGAAVSAPRAAPATSQAPGVAASAPNPAAASAAPTPTPTPASPSPLGEPATQRDAGDLAWLRHLVKVLAQKPATRADVIAYLGSDGGAADRGRRVTPRLSSITDVLVYSLDHVAIDVALDFRLTDRRPTRAAFQAALGPLRSVARNPNDFRSGPRLAFYEQGAYATVRVLVELDRNDANQVATVQVVVDGVKPQH